MDELVEFLRARLADDEAYARCAFGDHNEANAEWTEIWSGAVQVGEREDLVVTNDSGVSRHMVRHDPARVLADVAAKRQIVELAEEASTLDDLVESDRGVGQRDYGSNPLVGDQILKQLALPYSDHPDYDETWRPDD